MYKCCLCNVCRCIGAVLSVKVLGIFALIDEGETDWKVVAIANSSPLFEKLNCNLNTNAQIVHCMPINLITHGFCLTAVIQPIYIYTFIYAYIGIGDIERELPSLIPTIVDWFKNYKTVDGKAQNTFAFNGEMKDQSFALQIIQENHQHWKVTQHTTADTQHTHT